LNIPGYISSSNDPQGQADGSSTGSMSCGVARSPALLVDNKQSQQSFLGRWASDGKATTAIPTSFAVDLSSIKSGWCRLLIASKE